MTFPVFPGSNPSGYNLTRSLRFRSSASARLSRTPASAGNRKTWTWSGWVKLSKDATTAQYIFTGNSAATDAGFLGFGFSSAATNFVVTGWATNWRITTQVFRDFSAWYHIVVVLDTTQTTANDRVKVYINGIQVTSFSTTNNPTQNADLGVNTAAAHYLSSYNGTNEPFDGYLTEVNFIDGQALTPSSFGETDTITGVWKPKRYAGTYGTNGFYLPFTDNSALTTSSNVGLGKDFSGNGNYWTTNNISITAGVTYDSMTDVPTLTSATAANFAVVNPLQYGSYVTLSNGNLTVTGNTSANSAAALATIGSLTSGKWYWEYTQGTVGSETCGICTQNMAGVSLINAENIAAYGIGVRANGNVYGGTVANITSWTTGDVIGIAVDCDNGAVYWSKNGTWLNSGVPTSGASKTGAVGVWTPSSTKIITPSFGAYNGGFVSPTFGQRPFAYTPPTGFVALNTYNLPDSTVLQGSKYMNAGLYTGTGSATALPVTGPANPDFVWIKSRSAATSHSLLDSLRSTATPYSLRLYSNATNAEYNYGSSLLTTTSTGFNLTTTDGDHNTNGATYVAWQWQAGQKTNVTNTSGTITSTVSVNASAGFSVVTYTGTGAAATVGHGLGVTPQLIIGRSRTNTFNWGVWHKSLQTLYGDNAWLRLNTTDAYITSFDVFDPQNNTSSVFGIGSEATMNASGSNYVAYCWTPIAGYSAFGSYTGNGSSDGPFVYTGFRPKFVLFKRTDSAANWEILDSTRNTYNLTNLGLYPDLAFAEQVETNNVLDLLSNGFKVRGTGSASNVNGASYIYACWAETPFKNSLAR